VKSVSKNYDFIIAVGVRALFIVGIYSFFSNTNFAYLSLELYIRKEMMSIKGKVFKFLESYFNRRASFSIIQDKLRADILARENKVQKEHILIFPNSPLTANRKNYKPENIFTKFGLAGKKVILYGGAIFARWAMVKDLIRASQDLPDDWVFLLHSRATLNDIKSFKLEISENQKEKIKLSTEPLSIEEYEQLVRACHVGIALYNAKVSENLYYIGYSSGKISQYLMCGKPVIINRLPLIDRLVEDYECGVVIDDPQEIKNAILKIEESYEKFSSKLLDRVSFWSMDIKLPSLIKEDLFDTNINFINNLKKIVFAKTALEPEWANT
jgi:glycosyltransferase involved in cell wall biosynthesis